MARKKKSEEIRPPQPGERIYWNADTEAAIVRYNKETDATVREHIYRHHLAYPLDKMAENIINTFKFPYINFTFAELKSQVVSHIICSLHKYTPDKGKSFSYFSVIAKNFLILHNNFSYKEEKKLTSLSIDDEQNTSVTNVTEYHIINDELHEELREFFTLFVKYWDLNLHRVFKKPKDVKIATAIIQLFRRVDGIENFNKKNIYLLLREQTDCKTTYVTKIVNKMKAILATQLKEYHEYGVIGLEEDKYFKYN